MSFPNIVTGDGGTLPVPAKETARIVGTELPHAFNAITETLPPAVPVVVVMLVVVEAPNQVVGKVQL